MCEGQMVEDSAVCKEQTEVNRVECEKQAAVCEDNTQEASNSAV